MLSILGDGSGGKKHPVDRLSFQNTSLVFSTYFCHYTAKLEMPPKKSSLSRKEDVSFKVCESVNDPPSFELDRWTLGVSLSLCAKEKDKRKSAEGQT